MLLAPSTTPDRAMYGAPILLTQHSTLPIMVSLSLLQRPLARAGAFSSTRLIAARRTQSHGVSCRLQAAQQAPGVCAPYSSAASAASKRDLLLASLLLGLSMPAAAMAAGSDADEGYSTAPNGLQWKDTKEGSGAAPVKGSLIRCTKQQGMPVGHSSMAFAVV